MKFLLQDHNPAYSVSDQRVVNDLVSRTKYVDLVAYNDPLHIAHLMIFHPTPVFRDKSILSLFS